MKIEIANVVDAILIIIIGAVTLAPFISVIMTHHS